VNLELKSGSVSYFDQGQGSVVLLIHAFPLNRTMWEPQLARLSSEFRVLAPDIRGFGGSQPPSPWTMEGMADELDEFLETLEIPECAVVGVSMGGYIALSFCGKYPKRIGQLVLSNSRARADNETEKAARNEMIAALEQTGPSILPDRMLPRLLKPNPQIEVVENVRKMIDDVSASAAIHALMAMRDRPDSSTLLYRIGCPTMVIAGAEDAIIRVADSRAMADVIPGSHFQRIPNSGHLSNLENPQQFNQALLDFLHPS
jgi:pimeloyl-ACP methyl ester carboxylesterase